MFVAAEKNQVALTSPRPCSLRRSGAMVSDVNRPHRSNICHTGGGCGFQRICGIFSLSHGCDQPFSTRQITISRAQRGIARSAATTIAHHSGFQRLPRYLPYPANTTVWISNSVRTQSVFHVRPLRGGDEYTGCSIRQRTLPSAVQVHTNLDT